jgi:hypothetical protein
MDEINRNEDFDTRIEILRNDQHNLLDGDQVLAIQAPLDLF